MSGLLHFYQIDNIIDECEHVDSVNALCRAYSISTLTPGNPVKSRDQEHIFARLIAIFAYSDENQPFFWLFQIFPVFSPIIHFFIASVKYLAEGFISIGIVQIQNWYSSQYE